jgi:uncharacterized protein
MSYRMNRAQMHDVAIGACVLASGGGGSYQAARKMLDRGVPAGASATVVEVDEVDDDAWLCVSANMGSPSALFGTVNEFAASNAFEGFQRYLRQTSPAPPFGYVLPVEVGAVNSIAPLTVAVQQGVPVVDADGAGRSIPTLPLSTYAANRLPLFPNCIASNSTGRGAPYHMASIQIAGDEPETHAELAFLGVQMSAPFGGVAGLAAYAMSGRTLREKPPARGSLTLALRVGEQYRRGAGHERALALAAGISRAGRACKEIFHGYITRMAQATGSTDTGHIVVSERRDGAGTQLWIYNRNESIYACHSELGAPYIMGPDSICYVPAGADQEVFDNSDLWRLFQGSSYEPLEVHVLGVEAPSVVLHNARLMQSWQAQRAELGHAGPFLQRWLGH